MWNQNHKDLQDHKDQDTTTTIVQTTNSDCFHNIRSGNFFMEFPIFVSCKDKTAIAYHLPILENKKSPESKLGAFCFDVQV